MISDDIAAALERATFAYLGTRDHHMVPRIHRVYGWQLSEDRTALRCYVPGEYDDGLLDAIADNQEAALTLTESGTLTTYQLKGKVEHREDPTATDMERFEHYRERVFATLGKVMGPQAGAKRAMMGAPAHALTMRIRAVFDQTPGPNAGARVPRSHGEKP